MHKILLLL